MAQNYKKKSRGLSSANYAQKLHKILRCVSTTSFILLIAITNSKALDIHLLKAPSDGAEKMKKYSIVRSVDDDGYVIAGTTPANVYTAPSVNVMKVDDNGSVVWSHYYGFPGKHFDATHIDYNVAKNGYVISGITNYEWLQYPGQVRPFVLEIDDVGTQLRHRVFDFQGVFSKVKPTPKGFYIALGFVGDTTLQSPKEAIAVKLDDTLGVQWLHGYKGNYNTSASTKHYEGVQGIYVSYDGVNETYILGGNFTAPFTSLSRGLSPQTPTDYYIPIIDLREIDENGNIISQKQEIAVIWTLGNSHPYCQDIIIQDILVIEDPNSDYNNELIIVGQQIPYHDYGYLANDGHYLVLGKYNRNTFSRIQDFVAWHGVSAFPILNNYVRGNDIKYLDNKLYLFGSMEEIDYQVPALIEIDPILSMNSSDYNTTFFRDLSALSVAKYTGNKNEFPDYLGIGYPHTTFGSVAGQTFGHSLGYVDLDASNQLRYGIISRRKYQLSSTDWSLFMVSNVDNEFCYINDDYLVPETEYIDYVDTFQVNSQTTWIPSRTISFFDTFAMFQPVQCASTEMIFNNLNQKTIIDSQIKFYPNPSTSHINFEEVSGNEEYRIYDLKGDLILKGNLSEKEFIDISMLITGIYLLELRLNENIIFRDKLSKL